jgi:DNA polymerase III epsilon subunit-like protein
MTKTYAVMDTETTGMVHGEDTLVEVAAVHSGGAQRQSLVCPGERSISFGAMSTHHITDAMVRTAPGPDVALMDVLNAVPISLCSDCEGTGISEGHLEEWDCKMCHGAGLVFDTSGEPTLPDYLVFHNAEFDRGFLPEWLQAVPYICTWRCALHLLPSAESHSNGSLWYELGLAHPMPPEAGSMPHRALFDAIMTADILHWMIDAIMGDRTIIGLEEELPDADADRALLHLHHLTSSPALLTKCRFGKNHGERWVDLDSGFMEWVLRQDFDEDTKHTCRHHLRERGRLR